MKELRDQLAASIAALPKRLRYSLIAIAVAVVLIPFLVLAGSWGEALFASSVLLN